MGKIEIKKLGEEYYAALVEIWAEAVRATHHFLSEEDFNYFHARIGAEYLPSVRLYGAFQTGSECLGFMGLREDDKKSELHVEMLFIRPGWHRHGLGRALLDFAKARAKSIFLDVNEQNTGAVDFYLNQGFEIIGRSALDPGGKPYPLLHLFFKNY